MLSTIFGFKHKVSKDKAKLILAGSSDDKVFVVNNGMMIRTLYELRDALTNMSEDTFKYHANESRNDFHNWIRDVHEDTHLASELTKVDSKDEAAKTLDKRINYLERRSNNKLF